MAEIDESVIKRTQASLGKYVKKPVLTDKLLKKPPFRFLYDVINAVIKDTGYFDGLYSAEELNYENINDREGKMKFLKKMIDALTLIINDPVDARPSKIVAGHEPEKTNELLQFIGYTIEKNLDWKQAVAKVNNAEESPSTGTKAKSKDKETKEKKAKDKSSTKKSDTTKEKTKTDAKEKIRSKETKEKSKSKDTSGGKVTEKKIKTKSPLKDTPKKVAIKIKIPIAHDEATKVDQDKTPKRANHEVEQTLESSSTDLEKALISPPPSPIKEEPRKNIRAAENFTSATEQLIDGNSSRKSSGGKRSSGKRKKSAEKASQKPKIDEATAQSSDPVDSLKSVSEEPSYLASSSSKKLSSPPSLSDMKRESTFVRDDSKAPSRTSLRPPSARPASARPGAPRRRDKNIEIVLQPNDQIKLSGISVKLETFNSELEDDGENLVIIENPNTEEQIERALSKDETVNEDDNQHKGHLVQQILETQKELTHSSTPDTEQKKDLETDISKSSSRQSSARQMNNLRDIIQNLTKSVNPLGKLMDFIPEDIDAMQLELTMWRDTYNQSSMELKKERSLTESVTEPMKNQLVTIEANIKEYHEMIDACRAKILQNSDKIQRLLTTQ